MKVLPKSLCVILVAFTWIMLPATVLAKPVACSGVSAKCTTSDKTIGGKEYSCEVCKQTVCNGDKIAGTETTSVCTETAAAPTTSANPYNSVRGAGRVSVGKRHLADPITRPSSRNQNKNAVSAQTTITEMVGGSGGKDDGSEAFDEADSLFGNRSNSEVEKRNPGKRPSHSKLRTPTNLVVSTVGSDKLLLTWQTIRRRNLA